MPREQIAKITRPHPVAAVRRPRLFRLLDAERRRHPILWVSGPPGAGKTVLLSTYLEVRKLRGLWYQVDSGDADVATLFYYLALAVKKLKPRYRRPLPHLTPEYLLGLETFARRFFEELFERLPKPGALVFDNVQEVRSHPAWETMLSHALDVVPRGVSVFFLSREEPPAALARLRVSGSLAVLGGKALDLTLPEARAMARVRGARQRNVRSVVSHLHRRARGWAAGLRLLLEQAQNGGARVGEHEDTPAALFDYLAAEFFERLPPQAREVLVRTAFAPWVTASMAATLSDDPRALRILEDLARRNYFVIQKPLAERAYQYHPLFREFLLARADRVLSPGALQETRLASAKLLTAAGHPEAAVDLLDAAADADALAALLLEQAPALVAQGRIELVLDWLGRLAPERVAGNASLSYWLGMALLSRGPAEARPHFARALKLYEEHADATGAYQAWAGIIESYMLGWQDMKTMGAWIPVFEGLERRFGPPPAGITSRVHTALLGLLIFQQPHHPRLEAWGQRAVDLLQTEPDPGLRVMLARAVYEYQWWIGRAADLGPTVEALRSCLASSALSPLARIVGLWCESSFQSMVGALSACRASLDRAFALAEETGVRVLDSQLHAIAGYTSIWEQDFDAFQRHAKRMGELTPPEARMQVSHHHYLLGCASLRRGDFANARTHAEAALRLSLEMGLPIPITQYRLLFAQALLDLGELDAARRELKEVRRVVGNAGWMAEMVSYLVDAQIGFQTSDPSALATLKRGLELAREGGHRTFISYTGPRSRMAALLGRALEAGIEVEYVRTVIVESGLRDLAPLPELESWPWRVKIHALGRFGVEVEGRPVKFPHKPQRRPLDLLKLLVTLGAGRVPEAQTFDALWPDAEGDAANRAFSVALYRLRKLLGGHDILERQGGFVTLDAGRVFVDAWAFERAAGERSELAVRLYGGAFLPGEEAPWAEKHRSRLRDRYAQCVSELARRFDAAGRHEEIDALYQRAIELEPLAPALYESLLRFYVQRGEHRRAWACYNRCRAAFAAEGLEVPAPLSTLLRSNGR
jgi:ATP/maltotriose-dependent transcriptional regulator MalT/DNA-binding SARP family transcriptional activator